MEKHFLCLNVLIIAAVMLTADGHTDAAAPQKHSITVWFNASLGNALNAMALNIEDFHNAQDSYVVEMTLVPEGVYNDRILVAGQTGDLPDLLFFDGPMVSYLAWLRYLQPIDRFVSAEMKADFLPSILTEGRIVFVNLIANALKFTRTREHADIEIGCQPDQGTEVIVFVRVNGVGFDPKYADKLFDVFQRLHQTDEFDGTRIGLANMRRIIARHGGRTWAEGTVNQGATFYFSLPQR